MGMRVKIRKPTIHGEIAIQAARSSSETRSRRRADTRSSRASACASAISGARAIVDCLLGGLVRILQRVASRLVALQGRVDTVLLHDVLELGADRRLRHRDWEALLQDLRPELHRFVE